MPLELFVLESVLAVAVLDVERPRSFSTVCAAFCAEAVSPDFVAARSVSRSAAKLLVLEDVALFVKSDVE